MHRRHDHGFHSYQMNGYLPSRWMVRYMSKGREKVIPSKEPIKTLTELEEIRLSWVNGGESKEISATGKIGQKSVNDPKS